MLLTDKHVGFFQIVSIFYITNSVHPSVEFVFERPSSIKAGKILLRGEASEWRSGPPNQITNQHIELVCATDAADLNILSSRLRTKQITKWYTRHANNKLCAIANRTHYSRFGKWCYRTGQECESWIRFFFGFVVEVRVIIVNVWKWLNDTGTGPSAHTK